MIISCSKLSELTSETKTDKLYFYENIHRVQMNAKEKYKIYSGRLWLWLISDLQKETQGH